MSVHYTAMYPCQADMYKYLERMDPHIFNYVCISGDQLFLVRDKPSKQFKVISSGWHPLDFKPDKLEKYHTLYSSSHFQDAKNMFIKYVQHILAFNPSLFGNTL